MATYDYDDFRISFARSGDAAYAITARAADGSEVGSSFTVPMPQAELEAAVLALGRSRSRKVALEVALEARASAEQLGGALGSALFDTALGPFLDAARHRAEAAGRGVRLTLSLAGTPELLNVPWELLYRRPTFLASQRRTPVVRYLETGKPPDPQRIDGAVRVLGVVASPSDLPHLDVEEERRRVGAALAPMVQRGLVTLDWCDPATPRTLRQALRDGSYHVLHFVGHSNFSAAGDGELYLQDDQGASAPVTDAVLTNLLGDQESLRLAILNSCEGARTTLTDPFAGIATSLVALGVPAVVAMQFTISDRAAIVFAEELFTSLIGRQYPIDAAVSEARKAVFTEVNEIEWATPVLFLNAADGRLFDFARAPAALPPPPPSTLDQRETEPAPAAQAPSRLPPPPPPSGSGPPPAPRRRRRVALAVGGVAVLVVALLAIARPWGRDGTNAPPETAIPGSRIADETSLLDDATPVDDPLTVEDLSTEACPPGAPTTGTVPDPPASDVPDEQAEGFAQLETWTSLVAEADPDGDNSAIFDRIGTIYPRWNEKMSERAFTRGFGGQAGQSLVYAGFDPDAPSIVHAGAIVYDDPVSQTPCLRTGLFCYSAEIAQDGTIIDDGQRAALPEAGLFRNVFLLGGWLRPDDVIDRDKGATVAEVLADQCAPGA